jgi:signal transduction histidine kinase
MVRHPQYGGQVQRLEVLVSDMLAFAKPLNLHCQPGKINQLLEEVVMLAGEKAARHSVTIVTELQENMPGTPYDQQLLQQALLNLINNALEASPPGERIVVRSQCDESNGSMATATRTGCKGSRSLFRHGSLPLSMPL